MTKQQINENQNRNEIISNELITDEDIEQIAIRMHATGKYCLETIRGKKVLYRPRCHQCYTMTDVDPFTGEKGKEAEHKITNHPAEFIFGYGMPTKTVLSWQAGDDKPPKWFRYEDKLVH